MHRLIPRKSNYEFSSLRKGCEDRKFAYEKFYIKGIVNKENSDISFIDLIHNQTLFSGGLT
jgi:hypothetical protein